MLSYALLMPGKTLPNKQHRAVVAPQAVTINGPTFLKSATRNEDNKQAKPTLINQPQAHILVISQVFPPDPAAVGQYVADLCEEMGNKGAKVSVITARRGYDDSSMVFASNERLGSVVIRRLPLSNFGKKTLAHRILGQILFCGQALLISFFYRKLTGILITTSPPLSPLLGYLISKSRSIPLYWWVMDINPDQICAVINVSHESLAVKLLDKCNILALRRSEGVITLDDEMATRLKNKCPPSRLLVQALWPLKPSADQKNTGTQGHPNSASEDFARRHGFDGKFVVMYSGNHTSQHPLNTLLEAADKLVTNGNVVFVFIGGGNAKHLIDLRAREGQKNIVSLPYQPLGGLHTALLAADLQTVIVGKSSVGIVHPSKLYTALALPCPILLVAPRNCPAREIVESLHAGWTVEDGEVDNLVAIIEHVASVPKLERTLAAESVARLAEQRYGREQAIRKILDFIGSSCLGSA